MGIFKKPLSLPLLAFTTIVLMLLRRVNASDSLFFTFNDFDPDAKDLIFQGDAQISSSRVLQLTKTDNEGVPLQFTFGRALYDEPVRLWEKGTGRVSSFESTFTFELTSPPNENADGFTFFIALPESTIPAGTDGGYFALFNKTTALNPSANQVVAVEFDTYHDNIWDPNFDHIGIDVNTIKSSKYVKWDRKEGAIGTARVNYNGNTKNLRVVSSYPGSQDYTVSYDVDLKAIFPEWVRVGFSGASGQNIQVHKIRSWFFHSTLIYTAKKEEDMYIARVV